jgi:hypothetical protein
MFKIFFLRANLWLYNFTTFLPRQIIVVFISISYLFEIIKEFKNRLPSGGTSTNLITTIVRDSIGNFVEVIKENRYLNILTYPSHNFLFTWNFSILILTYAIIKSL